ncbi:AI-2E family transporter [Croceimicrobium hydrocarbonivorans]|uniref:AI-2E family transporter n=1 Tax=Croceimicrobium hydrocarbonivorans TaxID=2761580 RepID=A0A7H0VDJ2_9FLAO|nr:AI-2E family transporter [Croceimicrobium hydrocarbonivorans]QNR23790.1 AI-2E family transporter [Croceimicrobium hydrocarbonivorans]
MNKVTRQVLLSVFYLALIVWSGYMVWQVRYTLTYVLVSAVISIIGKPLVDALSGQRWPKLKINRSLAAALTLIIMMTLVGVLFSIFIPALMHELSVLANVDYESLYQEIQNEIISIQSSLGMDTSNSVNSIESSRIGSKVVEALSFDKVSDTFTNLIGSLGNTAFAIFSILFITFFFLREKFLFRNIVLALIPDKYDDRVHKVTPRLRNNLTRYFAGLLLQITIITTLVSVGLKIAGFHNTIVIGFFAGLINVIPYLGPIIGLAFGLLLGLAQTISNTNLELGSAFVIILSIFAVVQLIDNFITQPIVFSTSIRAHPLEIFLVISFAASIAGISGMIVAVPVYSVIRLLAAEFFPQVKFVRWLTQNDLNDEDLPA